MLARRSYSTAAPFGFLKDDKQQQSSRMNGYMAFSIFANIDFRELKGNHLRIKLQDLREHTLQLYHVI